MQKPKLNRSLDRQIQALFPVAIASLLILGSARILLESLRSYQSNAFRVSNDDRTKTPILLVADKDRIKDDCNVFQGRWVPDNVSYPLYREHDCPYLVKQVTCLRNGRPDSLYQNWRWQPDKCNLPRFDPLMMLEMLRGKRLMFVGDSIQRAQFDSLVCLIQSVIPHGKKSLKRIPPRKIFRIEDYDASIEYYWAPFIVESISDHATNHTVHKRMVKLDSVSNHSRVWEGVDVLVFESYVWWMYKPVIDATNVDYPHIPAFVQNKRGNVEGNLDPNGFSRFSRPRKITPTRYGSPHNVKEYNVTTAYRLALETWANWLESNIDPRRQKVFFMSMSPTHLWSWEWKPGSNENCFNESYPIQDNRNYWGTGSNLEITSILNDIIKGLKTDVTLLNITQMSEFRKDAHTTVFTERKGKLLTKEQKSDPKRFADCIHWCLPGVPDAWNEILYAYLLRDHQNIQ